MTNKTEGIIMYHCAPGSCRPIINCTAWLVILSALYLLIVEWLHPSLLVSRAVEIKDCVAAVDHCTTGNFFTGRGCVLFLCVFKLFKLILHSVSETSFSAPDVKEMVSYRGVCAC